MTEEPSGRLYSAVTNHWPKVASALVLTLGLVELVLLKLNAGVGFLLRVTNVERQPFRSMGFVSVIILSVRFALGLPLVLLCQRRMNFAGRTLHTPVR